MIHENNEKLIKKIENLDIYLKENNLNVFNIPKDKREDICGDVFYSNCTLDEVANYIYKPNDISKDYIPKIRGYVRYSEDWELKKVDVVKSLLAFRRLESDELYFDIKKINGDNKDLDRLFRDLKTGDTLIIFDTTHVLTESFTEQYLLSYIKNNKMRLIIGCYEYDCRNYDSSDELKYLQKSAMMISLMSYQISEKNFYYNTSKKSTNAKEERLFEEWRQKNLKEYEKRKK